MIVGMGHIGRRLAAGILAFTLSSAVMASEPDWFCPSSPGFPTGRQEWEKWFVGSIGSAGARMHLIGGGDIAKGEFYRQTDWKPVIVGGRMRADGTLRLHDEKESKCFADDECAGPGMLRAQLTMDGLTGTWKASPGDLPELMQMRVESAPKCDIVGPKRVFRDPRWPITFEYPAAWHVEASAQTIALLCPDPNRMASEGSNVSLTMGNLAPNGDLQDNGLTGFTRNTKGVWEYDSSLGGGSQPATVKQRDGLMIIVAEDASSRGYCLVGGYHGLVEGELELIIFNGHWILVNGGPEIVETAKPVAPLK